jgi:predicted transcriptional regulator
MESKFKNHFAWIKSIGWIRIYLLSTLIACGSQSPPESATLTSENGMSKGFGISIDTSGNITLEHETSTPTVKACIPSCRSYEHSRDSGSSRGGLGEVIVSFAKRIYGSIFGGSHSPTSDSSGALTKEISVRLGQRDHYYPSPKDALTVQKTEADSVVYRSMEHASSAINNDLKASVDQTNATLIQAAAAVTQLQEALNEAAQTHNQKIKELATSQEDLLTALQSLPKHTLKTLADSQGGRQIRDLLRYIESRKSYVDANPMLPQATKQELMNLASASALYADELFVQGEMEEAQWVVDGTYALVELAIGLSPAGLALDLYQAISGLDLQGNDIGKSGRILASASLLTFGTAKMLKSSEFAIGIVKNWAARFKNAENAADVGEVLEAGSKIVDSAKNAKAVITPFGDASQAITKEAIIARAKVESKQTMYRIGTRGTSQTGTKAQFWSLEHPKAPGYADRHGIKIDNVKNADFIETAEIKDGTEFITRHAPAWGDAKGGAVEVVVPEGGVKINSHSSLEPGWWE